MRERELIFLGLQAGPLIETDDRSKARAKYKVISVMVEDEKASRRNIQETHRTKYEKAQSYFDSKIRMLEAAEMTEAMKSQIRNWLLDVRKIKGKLPDQPKAADFDSIASARFLLEAQLAADAEHAAEGENGGEKKKKGKKGDKESKRQKDKDKKKKKRVKKGLIVTKLEPASMLPEMAQCNMLYNRDWRLRNEVVNEDQRHDEDMIIHEKRKLVCREVREQVSWSIKASPSTVYRILKHLALCNFITRRSTL